MAVLGEVRSYKRQTVYMADGRPMENKGVVEGPLQVGGGVRTTVFLMSDIATEAIVGSDFLKRNQMMVDIAGARVLWSLNQCQEESATELR